MLLYQNFSIIPTTGNNYDTCRPGTYVNKFITNNINNVDQGSFYTIPEDYVINYKYIPFIKQKIQTGKYNVFSGQQSVKSALNSFYNTVQKQYTNKISIQV